MASTQDNMARTVAPTNTYRHGVDLDEAIQDVGTLNETKQQNVVFEVPEKVNLSADEEKHGFEASPKTKMTDPNKRGNAKQEICTIQ